MSYRVIIAGGRDFNNPPLLTRECHAHLQPFLLLAIEVVSGKQKTWLKKERIWIGADYQGEQYADLRGYDVTPFYADWNHYGNAAGPIRNHAMGDYALAGTDGSSLIAFWDGSSGGTKDMIEYARSIGLPVKVVNY